MYLWILAPGMIQLTCDDSAYTCVSSIDGSRGGQGVRTPPPLKNHKNIGFLSNIGPDPLKNQQSYQASIKRWAIIGPPTKRHLNGVSLTGR